jgi:hypothetical protein
MQYQNYVTDVLEFAECDRIYRSSPYCIFGTEKNVSPVLACLIARTTEYIGGTRKLFSPDQFCVSASTASELGFQNKELNHF